MLEFCLVHCYSREPTAVLGDEVLQLQIRDSWTGRSVDVDQASLEQVGLLLLQHKHTATAST
jgi:hypothetical protein